MKKLLLLSAVLLGAIPASQAGVSVNIGLGLPLPPLPLPPFLVSRPPAVVVAPAPPPVCVPVAPPVYGPVYGYPAPVIVGPPYYRYYYPHRYGFAVRRGWEHPYGHR